MRDESCCLLSKRWSGSSQVRGRSRSRMPSERRCDPRRGGEHRGRGHAQSLAWSIAHQAARGWLPGRRRDCRGWFGGNQPSGRPESNYCLQLRLSRRAASGAGPQRVAGPKRTRHPACGSHPRAVRHRRRLPVRVRQAQGGRDGAGAGGRGGGGGSGVGVAAIQLAKRAGATVLATASSDARLERLKPLGLDHGINYRTDDVVKSVMKITNNRGVDLVVDPVGGATLQGSLLSLAYRGRVSMVGAAGREPMTVHVSPLMAGNRSLTGVFLGAEMGTDRVHNMIQRLIEEAARGEFKIVIDRTF